jgi:hypothetical protein
LTHIARQSGGQSNSSVCPLEISEVFSIGFSRPESARIAFYRRKNAVRILPPESGGNLYTSSLALVPATFSKQEPENDCSKSWTAE